MPAALVVCRRAETPGRCLLDLDAVEVAVEREVEVEARLLAVGDHVEARGDLVVHGADNCVLGQLVEIVAAELVEMGGCELEPPRQRVAPDHRRPERSLGHASILGP